MVPLTYHKLFGAWCILQLLPFASCGDLDVLPPLLTALADAEDELCRNHSQIFEENLQAASKWAVQMWDASAQQPTGWLYGNQAQFGNFDECLSTIAPFPIQFCLAHVTLMPNIGQSSSSSVWRHIQATANDRVLLSRTALWQGVCVPTSCSPESLTTVGNRRNASRSVQWTVSLSKEFCTAADASSPISLGLILFWVVSAVIIVSVLLATYVDVQSQFEGCKLAGWLSLRKSWKILVAPAGNRDHPLSILHGLRVAAVVVVLYGHRLGIPVSFGAFNHGTWENNLRNPLFRFNAQSDMTVDTFFFLSGILMSYSSKSTSSAFSIVTRIFRLIPLYLWVIWFEASAMPSLGSGPLWNAVQVTESAHCAKNWWLNALFLQNYVKDSEMCLTHTWYIPCEFHFFLLALLLRPLVDWYRPIGLGVTRALTAVAIVVPGLITFRLKLDPLVLFYLPDFLANPRGSVTFLEAYTKSHNRAAAYLIGFLSGFYLASSESRQDKQNWKRSLGWFVASLALLFLSMAYGVRFYDPTSARLDWEVALFAAFRRPIWALGLFCLILAHRARPLPIVGRLLSCQAAVVLSRLSYGVYLIHFPIIMANMAKLRAAPVFNWFDVIFSGDLASCFIFSSLLFLFIEIPIKRLLTGVCFPIKPQTSKPSTDATTPV